MTDFLDEKRAEIIERLTELKPLVEEYQRLSAATLALAGVTEPTAANPTRSMPFPHRQSGRSPKSASDSSIPLEGQKKSLPGGSDRRGGGKPKRGGVRAAQAVALVQAEPGITIPQLASKMGIKQNYLYRVLPSLEREGKISREGRGWHPGRT